MIHFFHQHIVPAAYALLPLEMCSPAATALVLAIGLQESMFEHRRQVNGPARGFFQFEKGGGVRGVLMHPASKTHAQAALSALEYPRSTWTPTACYAAIEHHDVLAFVFARLLLLTLPEPLPAREDFDGSWQQYLEAWRPGAPRPERWETNYRAAWNLVG